MGFTHQGHNIPWRVLAEVLVEEPEHARFLGGGKLGSSRLKVREDWSSERALKTVRHFARRFACTVEEFGRTEILKYNQRPPSNSSNLLIYEEQHFDDVLVAGKLQQVTYWKQMQDEAFRKSWMYVSSKFADVAIRLLHRGMIESLLLLVHEGIRLDMLAKGVYCNSPEYRFGIDWALELYVALNLGVALDNFKVGAHHTSWLAHLRKVREEALFRHDHSSAFFKQLDIDPSPQLISSQLSYLFRYLYQYHSVMAECGWHENWEREALRWIPTTTPAITEYSFTLQYPVHSCEERCPSSCT